MILIQANDTLYTYEEDRFQALPSLQEATITQVDFEQHGFDPTQPSEQDWDFFQDFPVIELLIFTTYEEEPEITATFKQLASSNLNLGYTGLVTRNLALGYTAEAKGLEKFKLTLEAFKDLYGYILLQVQDDLYTIKGGQIIKLEEVNLSQADFKAHGMTPEDVRKLTQETWRDFTISCDAMEFDILVFTTFDEEPEVILDATELVTFAAFDAILPTNVWKDNSFVIEVDSRTEPEGYPAQSVYYEIYKGTPENLLFSGMTPGSHIVENIEEDTVFILNTGAAGNLYFLVKREDENTLVVERSFPFGGAEWELGGDLEVTSEKVLLRPGTPKGVLLSEHSQIVTLGRKTISGVTVSGSDDLTEEVLVGEPMASIGENLYEAKIPKGKQLIIEVVE